MIANMLVLDYMKSKRDFLFKILLPFIIIFAAFQSGYGNMVLVMVLIFTILTGAGLKIAKLKNNNIYDRLLISPLDNKLFFLEFTATYTGLYILQFIPIFIVASFYNSFLIVPFLILAIAMIVIIGILIGIHATSFGEVHLYSIFTVIPLIGVAMMDNPISYMFPFLYITLPMFSIQGIFLCLIITIFLYIILIIDVSRI